MYNLCPSTALSFNYALTISLFNPCNFTKNVTTTAFLNLKSLSYAFFSICNLLLRLRCGVNGSSTLIWSSKSSYLMAWTTYSDVNLSTGYMFAT